MFPNLQALAGYEVVGRHGPLGSVIGFADATVTVAGGVSALAADGLIDLHLRPAQS